MTIAMDVKGFTNLRTKMWHAAQKSPEWSTAAAKAGGFVFERGMKRRCAVGRTGATRNSIKTKVVKQGVVEVGPHSLHASFLEYGTGLHTTYPGVTKKRIRPIKAKAMRWTSYGGRGLKNKNVVFAKSTAGMKPHPFIRPTFHEDHHQALKVMNAALKGEYKKVFHGG